MVHTIREAGKIPVQRDALYNTVREYPFDVIGAAPSAVVAGAALAR